MMLTNNLCNLQVFCLNINIVETLFFNFFYFLFLLLLHFCSFFFKHLRIFADTSAVVDRIPKYRSIISRKKKTEGR